MTYKQPFLLSVAFMQDRVNAGQDIYLSDPEAKEFKALAKIIDPDRYFTIYGCQACINTLVKFVFDNAAALEAVPVPAGDPVPVGHIEQPTSFIQSENFPTNETRQNESN